MRAKQNKIIKTMENLKNKINKKVASILLGICLLLAGYASSLIGNTNLGYNILTDNTGCFSSSATTSPKYMTSQTGTTTVSCGTGNDESMRVFSWLIASSTATKYAFRVERSLDGIDWYQDAGELMNTDLMSFTANATSTQLVNQTEFIYPFASSTKEAELTVGVGGHATTSAKLLSFEIPTTGSKFIRIVSYLTPGSYNGAIHLKLVPSRISK